jgi:hypothetical protein
MFWTVTVGTFCRFRGPVPFLGVRYICWHPCGVCLITLLVLVFKCWLSIKNLNDSYFLVFEAQFLFLEYTCWHLCGECLITVLPFKNGGSVSRIREICSVYRCLPIWKYLWNHKRHFQNLRNDTTLYDKCSKIPDYRYLLRFVGTGTYPVTAHRLFAIIFL